MNPDSARLADEQTTLLAQLAQSRSRLLSLAQQGMLDLGTLVQVANREAYIAANLHLMPLDPKEHVLAAHAFARPYLERLAQHDPARLVVADETHTYTPRKILRRILDHALDHLNQIEQWLAWQQHGHVPTPTDGWATSAETLPEDLQPLSPADLRAWLWRIDLTISLVAQRARSLSSEQLDWTPPGGGWPLWQVVRHLAGGELYYAIWMEEALPEEPLARYSEVNLRLEQRLRRVFALAARGQVALIIDEETPSTPEQVAQMVLAEERTISGRDDVISD
ncbi:MAG TPA: DinB family protein [Ktedonobacterales bacterium]|nr:DinB family protein [Ktedonobacterales bacterium]